MKRIVSFSIGLLLLISYLPMVVQAMNTPVAIYVNGVKQSASATPKVVEEQAYISAEDLASIFGAALTWDADRTSVLLKTSQIELRVRADSNAAEVNGMIVSMGTKPLSEQGTLMIPLEMLGHPLGFKVIWDTLTQSVFIYKQGKPNPKQVIEDRTEQQSQVLPPTADVTAPSSSVLVRVDQDRVTILSSEPATPTHFYLSDRLPYRIVVDYPAAAFGYQGEADKSKFTGEILGGSSTYIGKVRYALNDTKTLRFVIELNRHGDYTLSQQQKSTVIDVKASAKKFKVVIDAGHGGKDPGASGYSDRFEKLFALELSRKVVDLMSKEAQLQPYLTRNDDTFVELEDRAEFANDLDADLFISIHGNTFTSAISGTETYYYTNESIGFGEIIHKRVVEATGLSDRGLRKAPYKVLRLSEMPSVLLELGYLSTKSDEDRLLDGAYQDKIAAAIVAASKEYLIK